MGTLAGLACLDEAVSNINQAPRIPSIAAEWISRGLKLEYTTMPGLESDLRFPTSDVTRTGSPFATERPRWARMP